LPVVGVFVQLKQIDLETPEVEKLGKVATLLDALLDAKLPAPELKAIRGQKIEECLHSYLLLLLHWEKYESSSLVHLVIIPYIQFQMKLLQRRNVSRFWNV